MKELNKYISKKFLTNVLLTYVMCVVLIFLIDFVEMLRMSAKSAETPFFLAAKLTFLRMPGFTEMIFPFAILIGGIGTFLLLSRSSELTIFRANGMSVWQFITPVLILASLIGVASFALYNPMAAKAKAQSEKIFAQSFGRSKSMFKSTGNGIWLRQKSADGASILHAKASSNGGLLLNGVTAYLFDKNHNFIERIEARDAMLSRRSWVLRDVKVSAVGFGAQHYNKYLIGTYLTPEQVKNSLGSLESVSFWDYPNQIQIAKDTGLPSLRYEIQYAAMLSRPLVFSIMVLLAATTALGVFRFGGVQKMLLTGLGAGFIFFLFAEITKNLAGAGVVSPNMAAWMPAVITGIVAITVLLHQEDG